MFLTFTTAWVPMILATRRSTPSGAACRYHHITMPRTLTASVSPSAMAHNLARVRRLLDDGSATRPNSTRLWAVVKANAYGHGLANALRGFAQADGMALLEFEGASWLRQQGWSRPILMLEGAFDAAEVSQAASQHLILAIHQPRHLQWLAAHQGPPVDVYLKLNTGMNRLGLRPGELDAFVRQLLKTPGARLRGIMTHFANADVPGGASDALATFDTVVQAVQSWLPAGQVLEQSVANSAALFALPNSHRHWVRPGIALYGASPFDDQDAAALGLRPAMTLSGSLLATQTLAEGEATGYGSNFVARQPIRIGIVDCGYADGYPRVAPTGTPVLVQGVRTRTLGRVSMDMLAVDLSPVPEAGPGAPVELWGETIPVDAVARSAGTLGYELLCAPSARVQRQVV